MSLHICLTITSLWELMTFSNLKLFGLSNKANTMKYRKIKLALYNKYCSFTTAMCFSVFLTSSPLHDCKLRFVSWYSLMISIMYPTHLQCSFGWNLICSLTQIYSILSRWLFIKTCIFFSDRCIHSLNIRSVQYYLKTIISYYFLKITYHII